MVLKFSTGATIALTGLRLTVGLRAGMESPPFYRTAAGASGLKNRKMKPLGSPPATGTCLIQLILNLSLKNSIC